MSAHNFLTVRHGETIFLLGTSGGAAFTRRIRAAFDRAVMPMYLLSRTMDPALGVFTGVLAYYLRETHPRTAPPDGSRLLDLVRWKFDRNKDAAPPRNPAAIQLDLQQMERDITGLKKK